MISECPTIFALPIRSSKARVPVNAGGDFGFGIKEALASSPH